MRLSFIVLILGVGMITLAACTTGQYAKEGTSDNGATPAEMLAGAETPADGEYFVVIATSQIKWHGEKVIGTNHDGVIRFSSGRLEIKNGQLISGEFSADMKTIETDQDISMLENHLRSSDFFNVEKYGEAKLIITGVSNGPEPDSYLVRADLTIKEITSPVTFIVYIGETDKKLKAATNLTIDRTIWDIKYASGRFFKDLGDTVIRDEIDLVIDLEAQRS